MNWMFYALINMAKLFALSGLVLLSMFALPLLASIFALGILLGFIRDVEPRFLPNKNKLPRLHLPHVKFVDSLLWLTRISHAYMQTARVPRDRHAP